MIGYIVFCFVYCRNIFSCFLSNSIANIFYGYSNAKEFYFRDDLDYSFFVSLDRPLQYILYYGIIILVTSIFLFGVYNIIKTKLMKNTKLDFRIKQIVSVVCATFLIAVSVLFVGICAHTLSIRNDVRNDVDKDMTYYSNLLIENMDDLTINDMNSFIDFYDNYFYTPYEVEDVDFNLLKYSDSEIKRKYRNVVSYSYMDLDSFKISFYSNASDVLSNSSMDADKETVAKAVRFAQENVKTSNIDFPIGQRVDFYFDRNTGETTLEIAYYGCGEIVYKSNDNGELIFVSYEFFED
jgi:hypothetical protein